VAPVLADEVVVLDAYRVGDVAVMQAEADP